MIALDTLRADVRAYAEHIAIALLGDPSDRSGAELRFGRRGSLAVTIAGPKAGLWHDFESKTGGDMLALIQREQRCDFVRACEIASEILARSYAEPPRTQSPHNEPSEQDKRRSALELFKEAQPFGGTMAASYLRETRRIDLDVLPGLDHILRFHPCCPFKPKQFRPCLLALWRDIVTDKARAILRIAIADDLTKLGMLSLGSTTGAAMKISPDSEVTQGLCIAEGLETALSAMMIEHRGAWLWPMWALGGTSGLLSFPVLPGIECLTIVVDRDPINPKTGKPPGEDFAAVCARRRLAAGREVIRLTPKTIGQDFNDIIRTGVRHER
jgi:Toprim domain